MQRILSSFLITTLAAFAPMAGMPFDCRAEDTLSIDKKDGNIVLSWPVSEKRYYVESTAILPGGWTFRSEPIVERGARREITIVPIEDETFLRLNAPLENTSVSIGGLLYDNWWEETGAPEPETDHPLWASRPDQASNTGTGAVTWRCKECHGWDYKGSDGAYAAGSHRTGISGIFGTLKPAPEVFELIKNDHGYGAAGLSDLDIWDLAKFVFDGQIDTEAILDVSGKFKGDLVRGKALYENGIGGNRSCANCHGFDGLALPPRSVEFHDYPGLVANENPWEFQHKVRFGQPGTQMPGAIGGGGTLQDVVDLAAYAQTLPQKAPEGSVAVGGLLYDNWWAAAGIPEPIADHPLWASRPDKTSNTVTGSVTWRCKECHGWDYKGVDGAYASGSHRTGIRGIFGTELTEQQVFELIKTDHEYDLAGLSDQNIQDLAKFVIEGQIDTAKIIDADGKFTGNSAIGETLYQNGIGANRSCAECHGDDGLGLPPGFDEFEEYPGLIANENPWEFQHKVRFGQPGTEMPGAVNGGGTTQDLADLAAFVQSLPQEPE